MDIKNKILSYLQTHNDVKKVELLSKIKIPERTLLRYVKALLDDKKIVKNKIGREVFYNISASFDIKLYFDKPYYERDRKHYNPHFLGDYEPNKSSFLSSEQIKTLENNVSNLPKIHTVNYQLNIRQMENILIDLSFASSNLEGNTYSYLDTEVLIKYNEEANTKSQFETQMILNHKNAIQYIIELKNQTIDIKHLLTLHRLLSTNLLQANLVGLIRNSEVQIGGSAYEPLVGEKQLQQEANLFISNYNQIKNPFEQALFSLVFLSYFQLFHDCNKRVSRLFANISLLKYGLPPLSLLQVNKKKYIDAILAIYELNDSSLIADIFVENYLLNYKRYVPVERL